MRQRHEVVSGEEVTGSASEATPGTEGGGREQLASRLVAPDGTHPDPVRFEAETDDGIAELACTHIAEHHAALGITEEQARSVIAQGAYDLPQR